jgi:hypothetical protein
LYRIYAFMMPKRIRNAALTEVPMIPPMVLNLSKREETAAAVAATTIDVMITIVEWPSEKNVPTVTGFWPVARRRRVIRSMA